MTTQAQTQPKTETKKPVATKSRAARPQVERPKSCLHAVVYVDHTYAPDPAKQDQIATRFINATLKSELGEKLNQPGIVEVVQVIRGRAIPFKAQRKMRSSKEMGPGKLGPVFS